MHQMQDPRLFLSIINQNNNSVLSSAALSLLELVPWHSYNLTISLPRAVQLDLTVCLESQPPDIKVQHAIIVSNAALTVPATWLHNATEVLSVARLITRDKSAVSRVLMGLSTDPPHPLPPTPCTCEPRDGAKDLIDAYIAQQSPKQSGRNASPAQRPSLRRPVAATAVSWPETTRFALGAQVKSRLMSAVDAYPETLYEFADGAGVESAAVLLYTFFGYAALRKTAAAAAHVAYLGYALLHLPHRPEGQFTLSSTLFTPLGAQVEGAGEYRVTMKVFGPPPPSPPPQPPLLQLSRSPAGSGRISGGGGDNSARKLALSPHAPRESQQRPDLRAGIAAAILAASRLGHKGAVAQQQEQQEGDVEGQNWEGGGEGGAAAEWDAPEGSQRLEELGKGLKQLQAMLEKREAGVHGGRHGGVELQDELKTLRAAQQQQAAYIMRQQGLRSKLEAYRSTVVTQERVIAKLESLLRASPRPDVDSYRGGGYGNYGGGGRDPTPPESQRWWAGDSEGREKEARSKANAAATSSATSSGWTEEVVELKASLRARDERISVLEEQMVENAKAAQEEISRLRLLLLDCDLDRPTPRGARWEGRGSSRGGR
ncbi:hypothetical protein JKP88DRAFT_272801 [Tribonema minus]|uniref:Uncharacterized protein n=1 Tax=Tribonema minus TaxID=303371 RepID=A0A835YWS4_9STRA|nr:hypothetical protein JKP88DRAFT_272801 [Tribonema minus]